MDGLLTRLDAPTLQRAFDSGSVHRGRAYLTEGHVEHVEVTDDLPDRVRAWGVVSGSRTTPYVANVRVGYSRAGLQVGSECTCPVGFNCKHGAAVLLLLRDRTAARRPAWGPWLCVPVSRRVC